MDLANNVFHDEPVWRWCGTSVTKKVAPVASKKVAPVASQKVASVASKKVAPVASKKVAPVASKKVAPVASQKVAPVASQKVASVTSTVPHVVVTSLDALEVQRLVAEESVDAVGVYLVSLMDTGTVACVDAVATGQAVIDSTATDTVPSELQSYGDVFASMTQLPVSRGEFDIAIQLLSGAVPPARRAYRTTVAEDAEVRSQLQKAIAKGHIVPSNSPFAAPVILIKKKDGSLRMCIDYRQLNNVTVKDRYPLPLIKVALDKLAGARYFSAVDMEAGYNQVRIKEEDERKAAFITNHGTFQPKVMQFGLSNAPSHFQRMMHAYLKPLINEGVVVVYLDDILIVGKGSREDHVADVRRVLDICRKHQLTLKLSKCHFFCESLDFLGHRVSREGRQPLDDKLAIIRDWPQPANASAMASFLGLVEYYHDYIPKFSTITAPLHDTIKESKQRLGFHFTKEDWQKNTAATQALESLKDKLCKGPVLALPVEIGKYRVTTDASRVAIGAVLEQLQEGRWRTLAFFSRRLTSTQRIWPARTLELLAVTQALLHWRHYVHSRDFEVLTDHRSLSTVMTQPDPFGPMIANQVVLGMLSVLTDFDPEINYIKGKDNVVADALSRAHALGSPTLGAAIDAVRVDTVPPEMVEQLVEAWEGLDPSTADGAAYAHLTRGVVMPRRWLNRVSRFRLSESGLPLYQVVVDAEDSWVVYVPAGFVRVVLQHYHELGHHAPSNLVPTIKRVFYWKSMRQDAKAMVDVCWACLSTKKSTQKPQGKFQSLDIPEWPWQHVTMDFTIGFPASPQGDRRALVVVDRLTKMIKTIVTPTEKDMSQHTFDALKAQLVEEWLGGVWPEVLITDRDPLFVSRAWRQEVAGVPGLQHRLSAVAHPQTDGQTERSIRDLKERMTALSLERQQQGLSALAWEELMGLAETAHNASVHRSTGMPPFEAWLGYVPDFGEPWPRAEDERDLPVEGRAAAERDRFAKLQGAIRAAQVSQGHHHDKRRKATESLMVDDFVFVKSQLIHSRPHYVPLSPYYEGPFRVTRIPSVNSCEVATGVDGDTRKVFNVEDLKRCGEMGEYAATPPLTDEDTARRLRAGEAQAIHLWPHRPGTIPRTSRLVSWKNCNPSWLTSVKKALIESLPADVKEALDIRSNPTDRPEGFVPDLPFIPPQEFQPLDRPADGREI